MRKKFLRNIITNVNNTSNKFFLCVLSSWEKTMAINDLIKRTCKALGENNKPTYVVMAIATVKGICRPMFTMMDKTENPETKKYTALREGLTEVIAIPAYWACGEIASKFAKSIKEQPLAKRAEKNLMFLGVCTAALFVIPALCSVAIKPIMDKMGLKAPKDKKDTQAQALNPPIQPAVITAPDVKLNTYPSMKTFTSRPNVGLRVGGL